MVISVMCSWGGANSERSGLRFNRKKNKPHASFEMNRSFDFEGRKLIENSRDTAEEGTIILMV